VKVPDSEKPTFEGREVVLGPRAGDYYIVEEGLAEGEVVVTKGNFKIDSALQIQAKPSMMSEKGGETISGASTPVPEHRNEHDAQHVAPVSVPGDVQGQLLSLID